MIHADGIYLGLPEEEHHADPALGSTDHKGLLQRPVQWQWKRMAALRDDLELGDGTEKEVAERAGRQAAGKAFGDAVHTMILEGQAAFDAKYVVHPERPEGLLVTKDQMRDALITQVQARLNAEAAATGERQTAVLDLPKTALVADHIRLCKVHNVGPLECDWLAEIAQLLEGRTELSRRWAATVRLIARLIDAPRDSLEGKSVREKVLTGGLAEVSVFWTTEDGVRCKGRFDFIKPKVIVDLKTFGAREDQDTIDAFTGAVQRFCYDVQAAVYLEGREAMRHLPVFGGTPEQRATMDKIIAYTGEQTWTWLSVQTAGMPEIDIQEFQASIVLGAAQQMVAKARRNYVEYRERYGDDQLWHSDRGIVILEDLTFPQSITSRGSERWRSL